MGHNEVDVEDEYENLEPSALFSFPKSKPLAISQQKHIKIPACVHIGTNTLRGVPLMSEQGTIPGTRVADRTLPEL